MSYGLNLTSKGRARDRHWAKNPVSGVYEPFIYIGGRERQANSATPLAVVSGNMASATVSSAVEADPLGGTTAAKVSATAVIATHGPQINFANLGPSNGQLTAGQTMGLRATVKAGTITQLQASVNGTAAINTVFNLTTGAKVSGGDFFRIEPTGGDSPDGPSTGFYDIYSTGIVFDGTTVGQLFGLKMVKGGTASFLGATTDDFTVWGASMEIGRGFQPVNYPTLPLYTANPPGPEIYSEDFGQYATPQPMTLHVEWLDQGNGQARANDNSAGLVSGIARFGSVDNTQPGSIEVTQDAAGFTAKLTNGANVSTSTIALTATPGDLVSLLPFVDGNGSMQLTGYVNAGAPVVGAPGNPVGLPGAWSDTLLTVGSLGYDKFGAMLLKQARLLKGGFDLGLLR